MGDPPHGAVVCDQVTAQSRPGRATACRAKRVRGAEFSPFLVAYNRTPIAGWLPPCQEISIHIYIINMYLYNIDMEAS